MISDNSIELWQLFVLAMIFLFDFEKIYDCIEYIEI